MRFFVRKLGRPKWSTSLAPSSASAILRMSAAVGIEILRLRKQRLEVCRQPGVIALIAPIETDAAKGDPRFARSKPNTITKLELECEDVLEDLASIRCAVSG